MGTCLKSTQEPADPPRFQNYPARARSARARRACALRALGLLLADGTPTGGRGEDFLSRQPDFFTETAVTSERKVEKSFPRWVSAGLYGIHHFLSVETLHGLSNLHHLFYLISENCPAILVILTTLCDKSCKKGFALLLISAKYIS